VDGDHAKNSTFILVKMGTVLEKPHFLMIRFTVTNQNKVKYLCY
jgi:hypothetical protein